MNSIKISQLLRAFGLLLAALTIMQSYFMLKQASKIESDLLYTSEVLIPTIQLTNEIKLDVVQVQQWLTDISATRGQDGLDDGFQEAALAAEQFRSTIDELILIHPQTASAYRELQPKFEAYYAEGQRMAQAYIDGGPSQGNATMASFDARAAAINLGLDALLSDLKTEIRQDVEHELADIDANRTLVYLFGGGFLILLALLIILGRLRIVKPAEYLVDELKAIADGDFSRNIQLKTQDEFGGIAESAKSIVDHLGSSLRNITSAGMQVSAYAHALTYVTDDVQLKSEQQTEGMGVVVSSIDGLTALGETVAVETSQASEVSSEIKQQAQKGDSLLEQSLTQSRELAERMNSAKETVNELAESSNKINEVMSVIQGIAEQTNLLALNAAIEAARAGEQGRGFAVVADEVRTLASRTQDSASQIETMIQNLQRRAQDTVDLITFNQEQASQNAQSSQQVIDALRQIFSAIDELDQMNQNITAASEAQTGKYQEVTEVIVTSKEISERFVFNSQQSDRFSKALSENAKEFSRLAAMLNVF